MTPLSARELELVRTPNDAALWAAYSIDLRAAGDIRADVIAQELGLPTKPGMEHPQIIRERHAAEWLNLPGYGLLDPDSGFWLEWIYGFVVAVVVDMRPKLVKWPPLADQFGLLLDSPAARLLRRVELHRLEEGSDPQHYVSKLVARERPALREAILSASPLSCTALGGLERLTVRGANLLAPLHLPKLRHLAIDSANLGSEGMKHLSESALPDLARLEISLGISDRLTPKERPRAASFATVLDALPQLREVSIHNVPYGDDLAVRIPRTAAASRLEVLDLSGTAIGKRGLQALRDSETHLPRLRALCLDAASFSTATSAKLGGLSSKLMVRRPDGKTVARHAIALAAACAAARLTSEATEESHRWAARIRGWASRWLFGELVGLGEYTGPEGLAILAWALGGVDVDKPEGYGAELLAELPYEPDLLLQVQTARLRDHVEIDEELRRVEDQLWDAWRSFHDVTAMRARLRALRWLAGFAPKWKDVPDHIARHELPRPPASSQDLVARVEQVWTEIEDRFREPLPGAVSEETIDEAEREIGFRFPPDLRASYLRHGAGSYPPVELLSLEGARRAWRESDRWTDWSSIAATGDGAGHGELSALRPGTWRRSWFPITAFESDSRCTDLDPTPSGKAGQIFYWSHEGPGPSNMEQPSFIAWLEWAASEHGFEVFDD